jgi:DNA-binding response OmpR family regulator
MAKILIAEDEPDIRDLLSFTLQYGGFEVIAVPNGIEAIERAGKDKPDLIMLDVRMPKMTGYDACKALKSNPETSAIPIVFLSAKGQDAEVKAGLEAGALDYILKPFAPDSLLKRVRELLDRKKDDEKSAPSEKGAVS